ncbi:MAG: hypothetical protein RLZZ08_1111 [Pseudomonadota bacterium]
MRSILLHAHRDASFESRFQAALDVARQFDGHLTCLQSVSYDIALPGDFYGTLAAEMIPVTAEEARRFREEMEARLQAEDIRWNWVEEAGMADSRLLEHAALADLVVLGATPPEADRRGPSQLVGTLALHGRAPLLVVPRHFRDFSVGGPALVAWNGSPEASRALRAAVPFLARSSKVWLASVAEPEADGPFDLPPLKGAEYLARHGIDCEVVELPKAPEGIAATLAEAAQAREASYMVMGAYGHSRVMEVLFGGVTRRTLADPALPLLLTH